MTDWWSRLSASLVICLGVLAGLSVVLDIGPPVRWLATLAFALFGPGLVVVRLARLPSMSMEIALVVPVSLTVDALVSGLVLYSGRWSADLVLALVIILAVGIALRQVLGPALHGRDATRANVP